MLAEATTASRVTPEQGYKKKTNTVSDFSRALEGFTWNVVDQRLAASDQAVEQRALSHVGAPQDDARELVCRCRGVAVGW
jgi:hypothetical protein